MKTVEKMLETTWNAANDLQDAETHGDFKRTTQQTLDTHQQEINALKSKGEKSRSLCWEKAKVFEKSFQM